MENNYRPISALPTLSKNIEKIVHKRVVEYLIENSLLSKQQFGFRAKRLTKFADTLFTDDIRRYVDNKMLVGCVFIDFSKAFDTLSHAMLLEKLPAYGINRLELDWFPSYLFNRKQVIAYNSHNSQPGIVTSGIPQDSYSGSVISDLCE